MSIRILIVDDHPMVRRGLHALLREVSNIEIVGEADNVFKSIECTTELEPDVVIMGLSMRCKDGFEAASKILKQYPQTKIIALSTYLDKWNVKRALKAGMSGYLLKNCTAKELNQAISTIFNGGRYISSEVEPVL
jgi:NarL family two-component system response regulator LiaR